MRHCLQWFKLGLLACLGPLTAIAKPSTTPVQQIATVQQSIGAHQHAMVHLRREYQQQYRELERLEKQLATTHHSLRHYQAALAQESVRLRQLGAAVRLKTDQLAEQRAHLTAHLRHVYVVERQPPWRRLLSLENPQQASRWMVYQTCLLRERQAMIEAIQRLTRSLLQEQQKVVRHNQVLGDLTKQKHALLEDLQRQQQNRQRVLKQLREQLSTRQQKIDALAAQQQALKKLLRATAQSAALATQKKQIPFAQQRHKLPWPTQGGIVSRFGERIAQSHLHTTGILIAAPEGKVVQAVHPGKVIFADWLRGFGLLIILDHGDGYMTIYAHNQYLYRQAGDWVAAGDTLARVGHSGGIRHNRLYFAIRHHGKPENPRHWLI